MSESEISTEDSSYTESDSTASEELERVCGEYDEKRRKYTRIIIWLILFLAILCLLIIILGLSLIVMNNMRVKEEKTSKSEVQEYLENNRKGYEYPFFTPRKEGEPEMRGTITSPTPIEGPLSIFNDEGEQVMLISTYEEFRELKNSVDNIPVAPLPKKAFDVQVEAYCCPTPLPRDGRASDDCYIMDRSRFLWPGVDEEQVEKQIIGSTLQGFMQKGNLRVSVQNACEEGYVLVPTITHIEESETGLTFVCYGVCGPPLFSEISRLHPTLVKSHDRNLMKEFHEDHMGECYQYSSSVKITEANSDELVAQDKFKHILNSYCGSVVIENTDERLKDEFSEIDNFCVARRGGCSFSGGINDLPTIEDLSPLMEEEIPEPYGEFEEGF